MASDHQRHDLYVAAVDSLGTVAADTLMELLPPAGWHDVARKSDIAELRAEMGALRAHVDLQFARMVRANIVATLASTVGTACLVLGAVSLGR